MNSNKTAVIKISILKVKVNIDNYYLTVTCSLRVRIKKKVNSRVSTRLLNDRASTYPENICISWSSRTNAPMTIHHNTRRTLSQKTKIKCFHGRCRAKRANKTRRLVLKTIMLDVVPFDRAREKIFF